MRYDRIVVFVRQLPGQYQEETGDYDKGQVVRVSRMANITSLGAEKVVFLYGKVVENALTVRVKTPFEGVFDYMEIDGKAYMVNMSRLLSQEQTFLVTERQ